MFFKHSTAALFPRTALGLVMAVGLACTAQAQSTEASPELLDVTQRWVNGALDAMRPSDGAAPLRMAVEIGALDSRLRLAPCAKVDPYVPAGTRLWGKTRLGLRCVDGAVKWNVFLPVTVRAYGAAWVIKGSVPSGAVLLEADAVLTEVDWAEDASPVMANPAQWVGQIASRALSAGQTVRQNTIKPAQAFQVGAQVRVLAQGRGFQISSDGEAMAPGFIGQSVRVKMGNGRVMSGMVVDSRTVKMEI
jgi:flagellar basal body P-ring formation protein FlgA